MGPLRDHVEDRVLLVDVVVAAVAVVMVVAAETGSQGAAVAAAGNNERRPRRRRRIAQNAALARAKRTIPEKRVTRGIQLFCRSASIWSIALTG